ncbi:MAG: toprim domain-containing protein [Proteobacteria bacterium]|nr:toprim domain-containing protein [Pseudomonadota bacterium]
MQTPKNEKPRNACGERTGAGTCDIGRNHSATIYASLEDFRAYILSEYGLALVGDIKADGAFHYLATEDKKGHKPFRYCVHLDDPANVYFNDLKRNFHGTWYPEGQQPLNPAEREQRRRDYEAKRAKREAEEQAKHSKRAAWANKLWQSARPADGSHPYLDRKGVGAYGLRLFPVWEKRIYPGGGGGSQFEVIPIKNVLLVPMKDETGALWNLQLIYPEKILLGDEERDKDFLPGARVSGLCHWLGPRTETVCLAEGLATGTTIHEASGYRVFVCFSAGNLVHVAQAVRAALPDARIVVCADNDLPDKNGRRAGQEWANKAAALVGGFVALPPVESESQKRDFNDWANDLSKEFSHD